MVVCWPVKEWNRITKSSLLMMEVETEFFRSLKPFIKKAPQVKVIRFGKNNGQTAAPWP